MERSQVAWAGVGLMGLPMAERLLDAGHDLLVWNRTISSVLPLVERGARAVESPRELCVADVVFTMVADDRALDAMSGPDGLFAGPPSSRKVSVWVDCSTVSVAASERAAVAARESGASYVAAPVSGNPSVVRAGNLVFAVSGPSVAYKSIEPLLDVIGRRSQYVGEGHEARIVKMCTNLMLAATMEALAEVLVLAGTAGISRRTMMEFINDSAVGSRFSQYKSEALIDLDFTPTFTARAQQKDLRLGLSQAAELDIALPMISAVDAVLARLIHGRGGGGRDIGALLEQIAVDSGITLDSE